MGKRIRSVMRWSLLLCLFLSFSGCAAQPSAQEPTAQSLPTEAAEIFREEAPEEEAAASEGIAFRYLYRGFTPVPLDDRASFDRFSQVGTRLILDEDSWYDYMGKFCPGIPYYEDFDFSQECLLTSVVLGARPPYAIAENRVSLRVENGYFVSEYDENPANWIYALNSDDTTHFYVEVLIINRKDVPSEVEKLAYRP